MVIRPQNARPAPRPAPAPAAPLQTLEPEGPTTPQRAQAARVVGHAPAAYAVEATTTGQVRAGPGARFELSKHVEGDARRARLDAWRTDALTRPQEGIARDYVFLVTAMSADKLARLNSSPDAIGAEKLTFASLISDRDDKTTTIGAIGLILTIDPGAVVGTCGIDTAWSLPTEDYDRDQIVAIIEGQYPPANPGFGRGPPRARPEHIPHVVHSPRELLDQTGPFCNNEVLLVSRDAAAVRASGVFVRTRDGEDLAGAKEVEAFTTTARRWGLPVVRIPM